MAEESEGTGKDKQVVKAQLLPQSILSAVKITPLSSIEQVLDHALVNKEKGKGLMVTDQIV
jgi:hypothetical protein